MRTRGLAVTFTPHSPGHSRVISPQSTPHHSTRTAHCLTTQLQHTMADNTSQASDVVMEVNEELDATVEDEINHDATQTDAMNVDGANDTEPAAVNGVMEEPVAFEARIPAKKDATLREFLGKMDEYAPIVSSSASRVSCRRAPHADQALRYPMQLQTTT